MNDVNLKRNRIQNQCESATSASAENDHVFTRLTSSAHQSAPKPFCVWQAAVTPHNLTKCHPSPPNLSSGFGPGSGLMMTTGSLPSSARGSCGQRSIVMHDILQPGLTVPAQLEIRETIVPRELASQLRSRCVLSKVGVSRHRPSGRA